MEENLMNKKVKLTELKIKSFVTRLDEKEKKMVYGGYTIVSACSLVVSDCDCFTEIGCPSIGPDKCNTQPVIGC